MRTGTFPVMHVTNIFPALLSGLSVCVFLDVIKIFNGVKVSYILLQFLKHPAEYIISHDHISLLFFVCFYE